LVEKNAKKLILMDFKEGMIKKDPENFSTEELRKNT